jgi:hypothetical protein
LLFSLYISLCSRLQVKVLVSVCRCPPTYSERVEKNVNEGRKSSLIRTVIGNLSSRIALDETYDEKEAGKEKRKPNGKTASQLYCRSRSATQREQQRLIPTSSHFASASFTRLSWDPSALPPSPTPSAISTLPSYRCSLLLRLVVHQLARSMSSSPLIDLDPVQKNDRRDVQNQGVRRARRDEVVVWQQG